MEEQRFENEDAKDEYIENLEKTEKGKFIIKLKRPFEYGEKTFSQFELEEPKVKHLRKLPSNPTMNDMLKMIGLLAQESDSVLDRVSPRDLPALTEFIEAFS